MCVFGYMQFREISIFWVKIFCRKNCCIIYCLNFFCAIFVSFSQKGFCIQFRAQQSHYIIFRKYKTVIFIEHFLYCRVIFTAPNPIPVLINPAFSFSMARKQL